MCLLANFNSLTGLSQIIELIENDDQNHMGLGRKLKFIQREFHTPKSQKSSRVMLLWQLGRLASFIKKTH